MSMGSDTGRRFHPLSPHHRRTVVAALGLSAVGSSGYSAITPALPELAELYDVSLAAIGLLQGGIAIPGILLTPVLGGLSDRLGRGRTALASMVVFGIAGTACALSTTFGIVLTLRIVQGAGFAGLIGLAPALIGDVVVDRDRRRFIAINTVVLTVSATVSPVLGGMLAGHDPRLVFLLYTAALLLLPLAVTGLPRGRGSAARLLPRPRAVASELRSQGALWTTLGTIPLTAVTVGLMTSATGGALPLSLDRVFDVPVAWRGLLVGMPNIGSAAGSSAVAALGHRAGDRVVVMVGLVLVATGLTVLGIAPNLLVLGVGALILGSGVGPVYSAAQHHAARHAVETRGFVVGTWSASSRLGQSVGPLLGGFLVGVVGPQQSFLVTASLGVLAVCGYGLAARRLPRPSSSVA